jgi:hypothetical protein
MKSTRLKLNKSLSPEAVKERIHSETMYGRKILFSFS